MGELGVCSSIAPALLIKGRSAYPAFPQWLGKNSTYRKSMRLIRELKQKLGTQAYAPRRAIQTEYVPLLLLSILRLLTRQRVEDAIDFLDQLNISNEMFKEHLLELCSNKQLTEQFESLAPS